MFTFEFQFNDWTIRVLPTSVPIVMEGVSFDLHVVTGWSFSNDNFSGEQVPIIIIVDKNIQVGT